MFKLWEDIKDAHRFTKIVSVFAEEGLGHLVDNAKLKMHIRPSTLIKLKFKKENYETFSDTDLAIRLRKSFEKLGPTFVKFGQMLSVRPDLLPKEYIEEFEKLQDNVPPISFGAVKKQLKKELGQQINKLFCEFNKKPLASASLAQVHKAKLKDNTVVVVKVQRPNIEALIRSDLRILKSIANLIKNSEKFRFIDPPHLVNELEKTTLRELDFKMEAHHMIKFRDNFKDYKQIVVPKVYSSHTSQRILTQEFINGFPLNDLLDGKKPPFSVDKMKIAKLGLDAFVKQVIEDGLFHADPHPGNLFVLPGNKLAYLDFGMMGLLDSKVQKEFSMLIISLGTKNTAMAIEKVLGMSQFSRMSNNSKFKKELYGIIEKWYGQQRKHISVGNLIYKIIQNCSENNIRLPSKFIMLGRALFIYDGITEKLCPSIVIDKELGLATQKYITKKLDIFGIAKDIIRNKEKYLLLLEELPDMVDEFHKIERGDFEVHLAHEDITSLRDSLVVNRSLKSIGVLILGLGLSGGFYAAKNYGLIDLSLNSALLFSFGIFLPFFAGFVYLINR